MNVIGNQIIEGVPYINGKRAKACKDKKCVFCTNEHLKEAYASWICPECGAHLGVDSLICMNNCHLSAASNRRFQNMLGEAAARAKSKEKMDG